MYMHIDAHVQNTQRARLPICCVKQYGLANFLEIEARTTQSQHQELMNTHARTHALHYTTHC